MLGNVCRGTEPQLSLASVALVSKPYFTLHLVLFSNGSFPKPCYVCPEHFSDTERLQLSLYGESAVCGLVLLPAAQTGNGMIASFVSSMAIGPNC